MMFLLDTDHISILQKQSGPEYTTLRIGPSDRSDRARTVVRSRAKAYNKLTFGHEGTASAVWRVAREIVVTGDRSLATRLW
jgi:hypothetical protein